MAVPTPRKQLSLDANLVFDLAEEQDFAPEFREVFLGRGYRSVSRLILLNSHPRPFRPRPFVNLCD